MPNASLWPLSTWKVPRCVGINGYPGTVSWHPGRLCSRPWSRDSLRHTTTTLMGHFSNSNSATPLMNTSPSSSSSLIASPASLLLFCWVISSQVCHQTCAARCKHYNRCAGRKPWLSPNSRRISLAIVVAAIVPPTTAQFHLLRLSVFKYYIFVLMCRSKRCATWSGFILLVSLVNFNMNWSLYECF